MQYLWLLQTRRTPRLASPTPRRYPSLLARRLGRTPAHLTGGSAVFILCPFALPPKSSPESRSKPTNPLGLLHR